LQFPSKNKPTSGRGENGQNEAGARGRKGGLLGTTRELKPPVPTKEITPKRFRQGRNKKCKQRKNGFCMGGPAGGKGRSHKAPPGKEEATGKLNSRPAKGKGRGYHRSPPQIGCSQNAKNSGGKENKGGAK